MFSLIRRTQQRAELVAIWDLNTAIHGKRHPFLNRDVIHNAPRGAPPNRSLPAGRRRIVHPPDVPVAVNLLTTR